MKSTMLLITVSLVTAVLGISCSREDNKPPTQETVASQQAPAVKPANAELRLQAVLDGTPPVMPLIDMRADRKCSAMHMKPVSFQKVLVGRNGGLQNVFIYVKHGLGSLTFPSPNTPVELVQHGCTYEPHVLGMMVNQPLQIVNDDPVLHNIHALPKSNTSFNIAQPKRGMKMEKSFSHTEIMIPMKCEVHSWMKCYVGVLDNPFFAVSDSNGGCVIKGIPPGSYVLSAWHEEYGFKDQNVTLAPGETKSVEFRFSAR